MKTVFHKANTRGHANHGWLDSHHTFSFARYYDPARMNFGVLRVLNDDIVDAGMGFGRHPHDNMEIVSIPLEGELEHQDSMGNKQVIKKSEIQVMSAGTGIAHSEYNRSKTERTNFLQIWVIPNIQNVSPRYDQLEYDLDSNPNQLLQVLSPDKEDAGVWAHQDAWFHLGKLEKGTKLGYELKKEGNGVYAFLLEGKLDISGSLLEKRDGLGVWETEKLSLEAKEDSFILLMEVPMG